MRLSLVTGRVAHRMFPVVLEWAGQVPAAASRLTVRILRDGRPYGAIDPPGRRGARLSLPAGAYEIQIRAEGAPRWSSAGSWSIRVLEESGMTLRGPWRPAFHEGYSGGAVAYATTRGASASLGLRLTGAGWLGPVGPTRGAAEVEVDDAERARVDAFSPRFEPQRLLFARAWDVVGEHAITIRVVGTRERPMVAVDGLVTVSSSDGE